ncbi:MAG: hypothetical protein RBG13Loki_2540 [Promethearchaeota archaeon CR_4]|nr:MAG: hypothetical protein RBG13Loki_2540 [Candidatus Lokiarchaeota archaeon CR_4]
MSVDYATHVHRLIQSNPQLTAVAVCDTNGAILYQTENWDISSESKKVIDAWKARTTFVMLQGVKYSMLQCTEERLISTNIKKQGHLVGAMTPDKKFVVGYTIPEGNYQISYMDLARAADQMKEGGVPLSTQSGQFTQSDMQISEQAAPIISGAKQAPAAASGLDPALRQEIDNFMTWIKNPEGLAAYIDYYINLNDQGKISQLAQIYNKFRQIFNF